MFLVNGTFRISKTSADRRIQEAIRSGNMAALAGIKYIPTAAQYTDADTGVTYNVAGVVGNVAAAASNGQHIQLSWDPVTDATSYNIYWKTTTGVTTANGTKISNVTSPYVHAGIKSGQTYYYIVTSVNQNIETAEAIASTEVSFTPANATIGEGVTPDVGH